MITELNNKIAPVIAMVDEAFDKQKSLAYQLVVAIGLDGIKLAVKDTHANKFIALENYCFQDVYTFDNVLDLLNIITSQSQLLKSKYKTATCLLANNLSTIVPLPLFEESKKLLYLKFNTNLNADDAVLVDDIKNLEAKNVYAFHEPLKSKLTSLMGNITFRHSSSVLLESILAQNKNQTTKKVAVHVYTTHFEVAVIEGKNLLFYNTFNYQTPEDFIYYLLFVYEQLHLNPETIEATFLGEIEKNSEIYTLTQKYIRTVKFGERSDNADYSYQLQTLPKHFYFTLFNNYV
ncbi:MAG: DUF3822 family protein [Bacteroidia bacterium]